MLAHAAQLRVTHEVRGLLHPGQEFLNFLA
jgi:hypothetical protein